MQLRGVLSFVWWCNCSPPPGLAQWNSGQKVLLLYPACILCQKSPHSEKQKDGVHTHTYSSVHRPQPCFTWLDVDPPNPNLNPFCSDLIPRCCFTRGSSPVQNNSFFFSESFSSGPDCVWLFCRQSTKYTAVSAVRVVPSYVPLSSSLSCLAFRVSTALTLHDGSRTFRNASQARRNSR